MKCYFSVAIFAFFLQFTNSAYPADLSYINFWKAVTLGGKEFKCEGAKSKNKLNKILGEAGWESAPPPIDWTTEHAVIVARKIENTKKPDMKFSGLLKEKNNIFLRYGWGYIPDTLGTKSIDMEYNTIANKIFRSITPEYSSMLIVSYKKDITDGKEFFCREE